METTSTPQPKLNVMAEQIAIALARRNQTRTWLANKAGIPVSTVNSWYPTRNSTPTVDQAVAVSKALDIPLDQLLTGTVHSHPVVPDRLKEAVAFLEKLNDDDLERVLLVLKTLQLSKEFKWSSNQ